MRDVRDAADGELDAELAAEEADAVAAMYSRPEGIGTAPRREGAAERRGGRLRAWLSRTW